MPWQQFTGFTSSNISGLRYDSDRSTLEVSFQHGGVYHYYDVPEHIWDAFKMAESKGKYLSDNVKGHYRYSKV